MRVELLKLSIFAPKKLCGRRTVNRSETRTTLILDRYKQAEEKNNDSMTMKFLLHKDKEEK